MMSKAEIRVWVNERQRELLEVLIERRWNDLRAAGRSRILSEEQYIEIEDLRELRIEIRQAGT
jgi:hypothetical protein